MDNKHLRSKLEYAVLEKWILKIFEDIFTMTQLTEIIDIYDKSKN